MITLLTTFVISGLIIGKQLKADSEMSSKNEKSTGELIESQITINASPEKVWNILTDFEKYPEWNSFIKSIEGQAETGKKLKVKIQPPGGSAMKFTPQVLVCTKNSEFRWLGHFLIPGLFDGEHIFKIQDNGDGTTTFIQNERFKGLLVPLFKKMLESNTKNGFLLMNKNLKERAEE